MSFENILKENFEIKIEPMDPENGSGKADVKAEEHFIDTALDLKEDKYINESYSGVKVEEYSINTTLDLLKDEYINECYTDIKIEEHSIDEEDFNFKKDKDSYHISDNEEHFRDSHFEDEETLNTHVSAHIRESIYSCNKCSKNFDQNSQLVRHLKSHTSEKNHSCNQCSKNFCYRSELITHLTTHTVVKNY